jgi:hypothetical protein
MMDKPRYFSRELVRSVPLEDCQQQPLTQTPKSKPKTAFERDFPESSRSQQEIDAERNKLQIDCFLEVSRPFNFMLVEDTLKDGDANLMVLDRRTHRILTRKDVGFNAALSEAWAYHEVTVKASYALDRELAEKRMKALSDEHKKLMRLAEEEYGHNIVSKPKASDCLKYLFREWERKRMLYVA